MEPVELDHERGALATALALGVVAVRADAGQEDVADLVLAGPVHGERRLEARRDDGGTIPRAPPLAFASGASSGWL
jgi:hypothetical protein